MTSRRRPQRGLHGEACGERIFCLCHAGGAQRFSGAARSDSGDYRTFGRWPERTYGPATFTRT